MGRGLGIGGGRLCAGRTGVRDLVVCCVGLTGVPGPGVLELMPPGDEILTTLGP